MIMLKKILPIMLLVLLYFSVFSNILYNESLNRWIDTSKLSCLTIDDSSANKIASCEKKKQYTQHIATPIDSTTSSKNEIKESIEESEITVKDDVGLEEWKIVFYYKDALAAQETRVSYYRKKF